MRKRLAFARINQETNALSPVPTTLEDFKSVHDIEGEALVRASSRLAPEVEGMFRNAELTGFNDALRGRTDAEPVPLFSTWAVASGALTTETFEALGNRLLESLERAGRLDGVYLALHGALGAKGVEDPESVWLRRVRAAHPHIPIVVSYDLHGNLTQKKVEACDAFVAYGTNPHRDHVRVGQKCGQILLGLSKGKLKPTTSWHSLPMILGGGRTIDFLSPMRRVFRRARSMERASGVLATSVFMCHPWNDSRNLGWATAATTHGDLASAQALAEELAEMCWARRNELPPEFVGPDQAIEMAKGARLQRRLGTCVMADASDVVTAGAPGENTQLLDALLRKAAPLLCYVPIRDTQLARDCFQRQIGELIEAKVGGQLDPARGTPLAIRGKLRSKAELPGFKKVVVLEIDHVRLVVTEGPAIAVKPAFYSDVGLDPLRADVCVVKNFFPFLLFFLPYNRKTIFVKTSGVTDFDAAFSLQFDGPMHPRDRVDDWRSRDAERHQKA